MCDHCVSSLAAFIQQAAARMLGAPGSNLSGTLHITQAAGAKPFSLDASLAVLRLYALQPSVARPETAAKVLLRALAQLPAADYRTCIYLVPERLQARCSAVGRARAVHAPTADFTRHFDKTSVWCSWGKIHKPRMPGTGLRREACECCRHCSWRGRSSCRRQAALRPSKFKVAATTWMACGADVSPL
jgi:hypothetical protein